MRFATRRAKREATAASAEGDGSESSRALPTRDAATALVAPGQALTISMVYRAMQIHTTAAMQISLGVWRGDLAVEVPSWLIKPDTDMSMSAFIELSVMSLGLHGNAFWRVYRSASGDVARLEVLDPNECAFALNDARRVVGLWHRGALLCRDEYRHLALMRVPGVPYGLGPIQACRVELEGALDLRDFAGRWFRESDIPSGVLATDQQITAQQAKEAKQSWREAHAKREREVAVLGAGLRYSPIMLNPKDAQFLESQQFSATQLARLFGTPASLALVALEGTPQSYANVEQDWIGFTRFSLMRYLREFEEAATSLLPHTRRARFKLDALLRTDTKTRYEAHKLGLDAGFLTIPEVRRLEGLDPLNTMEPPSDHT